MRLHALAALILALSVTAHADPKKACDLITQQDAAAALGAAVKPGAPAPGFGPASCRFVAETGQGQLTASASSADPRGSAMSMDMLVKNSSDMQKAVAVPGLGDKAVMSSTAAAGSVGIMVLTGSTRVTVNLNQLEPGQDTPARRDALIKTAKLIMSRL